MPAAQAVIGDRVNRAAGGSSAGTPEQARRSRDARHLLGGHPARSGAWGGQESTRLRLRVDRVVPLQPERLTFERFALRLLRWRTGIASIPRSAGGQVRAMMLGRQRTTCFTADGLRSRAAVAGGKRSQVYPTVW